MTVDRSFEEGNAASRRRLRELLERASDEQLITPMDAGWTASAVLVHMAFWDRRVVAVLDLWGPGGDGPLPTYHDDAVDWINDANKPIFLAIPPRVAARIALEAAEEADAAVAAMSDALLERNAALGLLVNPDRSEHRSEHLDELAPLLRPS